METGNIIKDAGKWMVSYMNGQTRDETVFSMAVKLRAHLASLGYSKNLIDDAVDFMLKDMEKGKQDV